MWLQYFFTCIWRNEIHPKILVKVWSLTLTINCLFKLYYISVRDTDNSIAAVEEGIVKNNPLLSLTHHFGPTENPAYSDTNSSDNEITPDLIQNHDVRVEIN